MSTLDDNSPTLNPISVLILIIFLNHVHGQFSNDVGDNILIKTVIMDDFNALLSLITVTLGSHNRGHMCCCIAWKSISLLCFPATSFPFTLALGENNTNKICGNTKLKSHKACV